MTPPQDGTRYYYEDQKQLPPLSWRKQKALRASVSDTLPDSSDKEGTPVVLTPLRARASSDYLDPDVKRRRMSLRSHSSLRNSSDPISTTTSSSSRRSSSARNNSRLVRGAARRASEPEPRKVGRTTRTATSAANVPRGRGGRPVLATSGKPPSSSSSSSSGSVGGRTTRTSARASAIALTTTSATIPNALETVRAPNRRTSTESIGTGRTAAAMSQHGTSTIPTNPELLGLESPGGSSSSNMPGGGGGGGGNFQPRRQSGTTALSLPEEQEGQDLVFPSTTTTTATTIDAEGKPRMVDLPPVPTLDEPAPMPIAFVAEAAEAAELTTSHGGVNGDVLPSSSIATNNTATGAAIGIATATSASRTQPSAFFATSSSHACEALSPPLPSLPPPSAEPTLRALLADSAQILGDHSLESAAPPTQTQTSH